MRTVLLIDGNPLMWRSACGHGEQHVCSGIVNYFFDIISKFDCSEVLLFWDSGKSRWRSDYYPDYKAHRDKQKAEYDLHEIEEQRKQAQAYLSYYGVRNISVYGVEADDAIAWSSKYFEKLTDFDRVVVVTRDRDLWQLISPKVHIYDHLDDKLIDANVCEQELGVSPDKIVDLKALIGDVSDNLKGVKGVGAKTALKLLSNYGGVDELLSLGNIKGLSKAKTTTKVLSQSEDLELTYQLVRLPTLEESSSYLTVEEFSQLQKELTKEVKPDPLSAQIESELINVHMSKVRVVSSLSYELQGLLSYLQPKGFEKSYTLSELDVKLTTCSKCPLRSKCNFPSLPQGVSSSEILILGRTFKDFKGEAGQCFDQFLSEVGLVRDQCWITYVCKCDPNDNCPPTYGEVQACKSHLKNEIELLKPKMIISFGHEAMSLVSPYKYGVAKHAGEVLISSENSLEYVGYVGIMVHPATALRSTQGVANFDYGTQKIKEFLVSKRG